ncbi:MAG: GPW/gp25 family protein [Bacteroidia bacterium]|nr:GPW/gp25 family protein [Bacteroidia bacterium]
MADTKDMFLGTGWSFPPRFNQAAGAVEMTGGFDDIRASLEILLGTRPGERVMQPKYGCNMEDLLFENLNTGTKTLMKDRIQTAILYFESRIEIERIELDDTRQNEGVILVRIDYIVSSTNSRFNFVFPYFLNEASELDMLTTNHPLAG